MEARSLFATLGMSTLLVAGAAFAGKAPKQDLCHPSGNSGAISTLSVNGNAVASHLDHGDWLPISFFADADGDGWGDAASTTAACVQPAGTVVDAGDCDDSDAAINPDADEVCNDGIDNDCDQQIDEDCNFETIEVTVTVDNGFMLWIDGVRYTLDNDLGWHLLDTITVDLPAGDHTIAIYAEGWGIHDWIAAAVRVDGQLVSLTGDGSWLTEGFRSSTSHPPVWQRAPAFSTGEPLTPAPAGWTDVNFDDSAWEVASLCAPGTFANYLPQTGELSVLHDLGAEAIWLGTNCTTPYSYHSTTVEWQHGFFRLNL